MVEYAPYPFLAHDAGRMRFVRARPTAMQKDTVIARSMHISGLNFFLFRPWCLHLSRLRSSSGPGSPDYNRLRQAIRQTAQTTKKSFLVTVTLSSMRWPGSGSHTALLSGSPPQVHRMSVALRFFRQSILQSISPCKRASGFPFRKVKLGVSQPVVQPPLGLIACSWIATFPGAQVACL